MSETNSGVDTEEQKKTDASRAHEGGEGRAAKLASAVENDPQLQNGALTFHDVVQLVPGLRVLVLAELIRGLGAVEGRWNAKKQTHDEAIDYPTRQKSAQIILGYADGLPPQTNFNINANTKPKDTPKATPALVEAMEREAARMRRELKAAPVEV